MKPITAGVFVAMCAVVLAVGPHEHNKVVCFWNSTSFERQGPAKFKIDELRPALTLCTHLIYGFAGIDTDRLEVVPLNPYIDTHVGHDFWKAVIQLKQSAPDLKVCLSIGGNADPYEKTHKYLLATRTSEARAKFVDSVGRLLNEYNFDCVDLAWQFPEVNVQKKRDAIGTAIHNVRKVLGYGKFKDTHEAEHREGFTILVRDLKNLLRQRNNKELTLTVLPHVNVTAYFDARSLVPNIDAVHLFAFDQKTPDRNPKEADYPAPIYESFGRARDENIDAQVSYWLERGAPGSKVVVGIPTYARAWKLTTGSLTTGVPPINSDGPSAPGPKTATPGLLSYPEVCSRLTVTAGDRLRRVPDPTKKYGSYAFQPYNDQTKTDGVWIGFEEPDTAGNKATYAKSKSLGGVAIYDLSLDDFSGVCDSSVKFPILRAAKSKL